MTTAAEYESDLIAAGMTPEDAHQLAERLFHAPLPTEVLATATIQPHQAPHDAILTPGGGAA